MTTVTNGPDNKAAPWLVNVADELCGLAKEAPTDDETFDKKYAELGSPELTGKVVMSAWKLEWEVEVLPYQHSGFMLVLDLSDGTVRLEDNGLKVGPALMLHTREVVM